MRGGSQRGAGSSVLSRIHLVRLCAKEPQRREERREMSEDSGSQSNHRLVTDLQAAQTCLSRRSSRLCGLMGLRSIAWLLLSPGLRVEPGESEGDVSDVAPLPGKGDMYSSITGLE